MALRSFVVLAMTLLQDVAPPREVTPEIVQQKLAAVATLEIDDAAKKDVTATLNEALDLLRQADQWSEQAKKLDADVAAAPAELDRIRAELSSPPSRPSASPVIGSDLKQLEREQAQAEADLAAARKLADDLAGDPARRQARRQELTDAMAKARAALAELIARPAPGSTTALDDAKSLAAAAKRVALDRQIAALDRELASLDATRELTAARRDRQTRIVAGLEDVAKQWRDLVATRRQTEVEEQQREAERQSREANEPQLKRLADENESLARTRAGQNDELKLARADLQRVREQLDLLTQRRTRSRRNVELGRLAVGKGSVLRHELEQLEPAKSLDAAVTETETRIGRVQDALLDFDERRAAAGDVELRLRELLLQVAPDRLAAERASIEARARDLLMQRQNTLDALIADGNLLFDVLLDLSVRRGELRDVSAEFRSFIAENILWVPSVAPGEGLDPSKIADSLRWFSNGEQWRSAAAKTGAYWSEHALAGLGRLLLIGLLLVGGRVARARLRSRPRDLTTVPRPFIAMARALMATLLKGAAVPLVLLIVARSISIVPGQTPVALAIARGLALSAQGLLAAFILFAALAEDGICRVELSWSGSILDRVRREFRRLIFIVLPCGFIVAALESPENEFENSALGRIAFVVGMLAVMVFAVRVLRPRPGEPLFGSRVALLACGILLPAWLVALNVLGYAYTAIELNRRFVASAWIGFGLLLVYALLTGWLRLSRHAPAKPDKDADDDEEDEQRRALEEQTRRLFRSGTAITALVLFYFVWSGVIPALKKLDRISIWPRVEVLEVAPQKDAPPAVAPPAAAGTPAAAPADASTPGAALVQSATRTAPSSNGSNESDRIITLGDLVLALFLAFVTTFATRSVPALVEFLLIRRLAVDAGTRYALATVLRYTLLVIGVVLIAATIGIDWASVQWLVAALTFGLAFGLQEIFANFISGLIILVERPLRVGDVVTVNGMSGNVLQIRMRATTIMDADQKVLVVPNKQLVTDQFVNWTLSRRVTRHVIPVGVAYGSDVKRVQTILLQTARAHRAVVRRPRPQAMLIGFGGSSLDFELRVYAPMDDQSLYLRHDLLVEIENQFRAAGIAIPYPTHDVNVRTMAAHEGEAAGAGADERSIERP